MEEPKRVKKADAAQIAYYLMAVDGHVTYHENEAFKEIAKGFGITEDEEWEEAVQRSRTILSKNVEPDQIYDKIRKEVQELLNDEDYLWQGNSVSSHLLIWNLMTLSISDNVYSENEEKIIRYVANKCEVDKTILLEMDNALKALYALTNEQNWLNKSGKPDKEIQSILCELHERKTMIQNSISIYFDSDEE